ncbi:uncharacterized protein LOC116286327 [Actinia tenebrosa]|uniref:Uncharacterized protein LOC116286327 n=1 Tax=Actinia tenebrosa TaxID=6105 RepID=A0A6P8GZX1_ACTTE|nr:uncharacterized protein LOC116286327 [Actinia tenebrosa]
MSSLRNAFDEWSYKKAATILTYYNYHPVPVPLNIISLTFLLMRYLYKKIRCRSSTVNIVEDPEKGGVQHRRSAQENDEKFKKMIIELESIHYTVHGDDFPIKTGDRLDHVVKQTDGNSHLIGHIAERLFTHGPNRKEGAGSDSRQKWDVKGIHILGNRLSYDSRDRHRCTIGDYEEYHGARYLAPLSPEMPGFEILIEEDSSINHRLILGVVDEVFDLNKIPEMEGNTVVYYTQKEQSFWPNIDHLPEMADRGDLLGCEILYGRESNGNLPVLFTLNGRVIWEGTIENGNPSTGRFYAFVGIGSKELSVRFKLLYLQQESHGVDQSSISLKQVLDQLRELVKQEVQGYRSEMQNNAEKNV